jgi:cobyrinic acid a,c-diamide synthase
MASNIPRLVIAGLSGDSGKTVVSLALTAALSKRGLRLSTFKKGPDYIDAAWLTTVSGSPCRNLDTFMISPEKVYSAFVHNTQSSDFTVIEGNRGLFDGKDETGSFSTAEIARLLKAPLILVVNSTKSTRTLAALIKGCIDFEPGLNIAGVILNRVAGDRHEQVIRKSIEKYCHLPVLGAIPKLDSNDELIPGRHLGLVTPAEFEDRSHLIDRLSKIAEECFDIGDLVGLAESAPQLGLIERSESPQKREPDIKIGYFRDSVFTFYYPENLEALLNAKTELVPISSLDDNTIPDIDALYIGGGFPETQAEKLCGNRELMNAINQAALNGLPIYAECGGLIYLSRSLLYNDNKYAMAGIFPLDLVIEKKPAGHGYVVAEVSGSNPFYDTGEKIIGHEFHYSTPVEMDDTLKYCLTVKRGHGIIKGYDGLIYKNCLALYTHIHAEGTVSWAKGLAKAARQYRKNKVATEGSSGNLRMAV